MCIRDSLGVLSGSVVRFPTSDLKVPHMGWNALTLSDSKDPLWKGLPPNPHLYFVHSYYPVPTDNDIVSATAEYGKPFAAAIRSGRTVATQFHPEKSQELGLKILQNFFVEAGI